MPDRSPRRPPAYERAATARRRQTATVESHHHAKGSLAALAFGALGVVYGDIGTSPLYALRECFHGLHAIAATPGNVYGVVSLIFWALMIVVTLKYIVFIMRADNEGEGGILVLTALASPVRKLQIGDRRLWIVLLGVFGAALLYGDGIITPAISVLSAVEGLNVAAPVLEPYIIPITVAIIIGLFMIQSRGTATIGRLFGPVMLTWFVVLAVLGIYNFVQRPEILGALNPIHAIQFFRVGGWHAFVVLGSVFLAVTGGEALYADMGHFGIKPIRSAWFFLVLPALILNYLGQGALMLRSPEAAENVLYLLAPEWARLPLVFLATAATIIASQALISGAYSITMQAENLGFLPRVNIVHTSPSAFGQIYIPLVNWLLMAACVIVVLGFRSSTHLAAAYGIAVTSTMVITTIIFAVVARERWRWSLPLVAIVAGFFLIVDLAFLGANVLKIVQGGWFPLVVAALIFVVMTTWKRGRALVFQREQEQELSLKQLLRRLKAQPIAKTPGTAVFLSANPESAPAALLTNIKYNHVIHQNVLLTTVRPQDTPFVEEARRVEVLPLVPGIHQVILRHGFMEDPNVPEALASVEIPGLSFDPRNVPYFVNRTRVVPTHLPGMAPWREQLFMLMQQNAASVADFFDLPKTRVFEIGTSVEI